MARDTCNICVILHINQKKNKTEQKKFINKMENMIKFSIDDSELRV